MTFYAKVVVDIKSNQFEQVFTYKIAEKYKDIIKIGHRVTVPFGRRKNIEAFVVGFTNEIDFPESKLRDINKILDDYPVLTKEVLELCYWMKDKYFTSLAQCIKTALPSLIKIKSEKIVYLLDNQMDLNISSILLQMIDFLDKHNGEISYNLLKNKFPNSFERNLKNLESKNIISISEKYYDKNKSKKMLYASLNKEIKSDIVLENLNKNKSLNAQLKVYEYLLTVSEDSINTMMKKLDISRSPFDTLEKKNFIKIYEKEINRDYFDRDENFPLEKVIINDMQQFIIDEIKGKIHSKSNENKTKPSLIYGVTASGKTEIYLNIVEEVLKLDKQAIVLVPEISLTPLMLERFKAKFGNKIALTHSRMSAGEQRDQWQKARLGKISIMIGPRSAIFAPFDNLGAIIIDEEHEHTYKSDVSPKYDTRELAIKRAKISNSVLVLGSATPSLESYQRAVDDKYTLFKLKERVSKRIMPKIEIVDLALEFRNGNRSIFSKSLQENIYKNLLDGMQSILFLNRRGHSTFVSCRYCSHVMKCDDCDVAYTYHQSQNILTCHYCSKIERVPTVCPVCKSKYIKFFGIGTQKIEDEVKKLYPNARVLRMDMDTTRKKHSHEKILKKFSNKEADILIGTQMIAKGHDFPDVTLVGIITADTSLNMGDYKSAENTYQLLTQVSGRAGRGDEKGHVVLQTYSPEHYAIKAVEEQNYESFFESEINIRRKMNYPPFSNIFTVLLKSKDEKNLIKEINRLKYIIENTDDKKDFNLLGPTPARVSKIKSEYRWRLIVKAIDEEELKKYMLECIEIWKKNITLADLKISLDINPSSIQ